MIELIGILACFVACISVPLQVSKMRAGWMPKKFAGTNAEYAAIFRKQLGILKWVGLGFGLLELAMIAIETAPGEWIFKAIAGIFWLTLSGICFVYDRALATLAAPGAG
ncbi:MAG TPA: hypothetical protein VHZ78_01120 [Rhizomicrobium sp.]|jgi:hypothetical protein|nr:hypothetical protein [Rhizomicrobium sp.]